MQNLSFLLKGMLKESRVLVVFADEFCIKSDEFFVENDEFR